MKAKLQSLLAQFEQKNDRAVSPVIGVILMVAITVILAAVIGTMVLGMTDSVQSSPQASIGVADITDDSGADDGTIVLRHTGGDALTIADLRFEVRVNGGSETVTAPSATEWKAGQQVTLTNVTVVGGDEVEVSIVHESSGQLIGDLSVTA